MKYRAIIFDLDGTAVDSPTQKLPSDNLIKAVDNLKSGFYLCSATGRVWPFAKPVINALKLTDPCIISAGTQICNPVTGEILWQKNLPAAAVDQVISIFERYPDYKILYNDYYEADYLHGGIDPVNFKANEPVFFLEQIFIPDAQADEIQANLNQIDGITCIMVVSQRPGCRDLHIVNAQATKEHAIEELLNIINVKKENTIGIGDGHNDLHLFNSVSQKIAMGNAVDELKTVADLVIGSVKEDGLAKYFQTLK